MLTLPAQDVVLRNQGDNISDDLNIIRSGETLNQTVCIRLVVASVDNLYK